MKKKSLGLFLKIKLSVQCIYKQKLILVAVCCIAVLFSGCRSENRTYEYSNSEDNQVTDSKPEENDSMAKITPAEVNTEEENRAEETPGVEESNSEEATLSFSELSKYEFVFYSGVGAWQTTLNIYDDGTFKGHYNDSDMGDTGEGYPNGTRYSSKFEGKFTTPKKINDYTYSMSIESIKLEEEVGKEEILDGIRYIYSEPYGLDGAKEIYIYTPQAPVDELPEGFRSWVTLMDYSEEKKEYLSYYGLYNVETECGFSSYEIDENENYSPVSDIKAEVAEIEKQYEEMRNRLKNEDLNQSQMNYLAQDIYVLWDDEINKIWKYMKESLAKEVMDKLTAEQRKWITWKENEIEKAGSEYEGGSIRPMIEYLKGAELTRDRVYELIELLN